MCKHVANAVEALKRWESACGVKRVTEFKKNKYWVCATTVTSGESIPTPMMRSTIANDLAKVMKKAGLDKKQYMPHSIKASTVSTKYRAGMTIEEIAHQGRNVDLRILRKHYLIPTDPAYEAHAKLRVQEVPYRPHPELE